MSGKTGTDRIRNEVVRHNIGVVPIEDKMKVDCLRWFGPMYIGDHNI